MLSGSHLKAPVCADGSMMDIWLPLTMGCGLVVAPSNDLKDPDTARALIKQHGVGFLCVVPSHFQVNLSHS